MLVEIEKVGKINLANNLLTTLKVLGETKTPFTFDVLVDSIVGNFELDETEMDSVQADSITINNDESIALHKDVILCLDSIGVSEPLLNDFLSRDNDVSMSAGVIIADMVSNLDENTIFDSIVKFGYKDTNVETELKENKMTTDGVMPERKPGYKRVLVVRDGKKVWINKRLPGKKVILTPKQKLALKKARLKAHTGLAKMKRKKSLAKRNQFGL